ncbi:hypothetical protein TNCV_1119921 [Trichonephila clavipes]|uniref:Uncharacterized protein n=1 Tax=Trichonephila clavipes TaxID=2585209 RepID=A0A8X6T007_TRICX|nr:hypothetical protein TNCV_1119921 [Trichonephila clavipes]
MTSLVMTPHRSAKYTKELKSENLDLVVPNSQIGLMYGSVQCIVRIETATAGSDVVQSGRPIFDDFFQHLWPYIGNNTANVVFQMVKRLWLIRIDQRLYIVPQKIV